MIDRALDNLVSRVAHHCSEPTTQTKGSQMKQAELMKVVESGKIVMVGTYWSGRLDKVSIRDRNAQGGPRRDSFVAREVVMTDNDPVVITRWLRDGENPDLWKPAAQKNERVVVVIQSMSSENGTIKLTGLVERFV